MADTLGRKVNRYSVGHGLGESEYTVSNQNLMANNSVSNLSSHSEYSSLGNRDAAYN